MQHFHSQRTTKKKGQNRSCPSFSSSSVDAVIKSDEHQKPGKSVTELCVAILVAGAADTLTVNCKRFYS